MLFLFPSAKIVQGEQESNISLLFIFAYRTRSNTQGGQTRLYGIRPHQVYLVHFGDKMVKIGM